MKHLKQEFDKLTIREVLVYVLAVFSTTAGFVLLFLGMLLPPEGQIHESVLTAFGIVCIFSGSLLGISIHYDNKTSEFMESVNRRIEAMKGGAI